MVLRTRSRVLLALSLFAIGGGAACILADPPAGLPVVPLAPPRILRDDVVPSVSLLAAFPQAFIVPVTVDTRESQLNSQFFIDGTELAYLEHSWPIESDGGVVVQVNDVQSDTTISLAECHTLEMLVFYATATTSSDSIEWFYSPTRSFADCAIFDAGPEDAAGDGGDG